MQTIKSVVVIVVVVGLVLVLFQIGRNRGVDPVGKIAGWFGTSNGGGANGGA